MFFDQASRQVDAKLDVLPLQCLSLPVRSTISNAVIDYNNATCCLALGIGSVGVRFEYNLSITCCWYRYHFRQSWLFQKCGMIVAHFQAEISYLWTIRGIVYSTRVSSTFRDQTLHPSERSAFANSEGNPLPQPSCHVHSLNRPSPRLSYTILAQACMHEVLAAVLLFWTGCPYVPSRSHRSSCSRSRMMSCLISTAFRSHIHPALGGTHTLRRPLAPIHAHLPGRGRHNNNG